MSGEMFYISCGFCAGVAATVLVLVFLANYLDDDDYDEDDF